MDPCLIDLRLVVALSWSLKFAHCSRRHRRKSPVDVLVGLFVVVNDRFLDNDKTNRCFNVSSE